MVKKELKTLTEKIIAEPECYRFEIRQSIENERIFIMWEEFASKEALEKHFAYQHTKVFVEKKLTTIEYAEFTEDF